MPHKSSSVGVLIPARYGSSRFPGKPLALLAGQPLIQHVYEAAVKVPGVSEVRIVTDDDRIVCATEEFGGQIIRIDSPCRTGTDRIAKAATQLTCPILVNLQADEIPLHPSLLRDLIDPFVESDHVMGTLKRRLLATEDVADTSLVKVVTDTQHNALYFSRLPIPYIRDNHINVTEPVMHYGHLGVYIFRRETLLQFADLPTGAMEDAEKLEQLRALEHGIPIRVWETTHASLRIDRPEDLKAAEDQYMRSIKPSQRYSPSSVTTA